MEGDDFMTLISHDEAHHLGDHQSGSGRARKGRPDARAKFP